MQNMIQEGKTLTAIAPAGGFTSGNAYKINALFGVASTTVDEAEPCELSVEGVYEIPAVSADTATAFQKAYWNDTSKEISNDATGNSVVGYYTEDKAAAQTVICVKLVPTVA